MKRLFLAVVAFLTAGLAAVVFFAAVVVFFAAGLAVVVFLVAVFFAAGFFYLASLKR